MIGRFLKEGERKDLCSGMDFREPQYRREVFLRFYEFHIKYKAHPGAVYYMIPYLRDALGLTMEQVLWLCFINGVSQNILTSYLIFQRFPDVHSLDVQEFSDWFRPNYEKFGWDTDRRYVKNKVETIFQNYKDNLAGRTQEEFFGQYITEGCPYASFQSLWGKVMEDFRFFGRLATFSYLEYLRIAGLDIDCDSLFLDNLSGSKSHRNGLCIVLGRDDLDWRDDNPVQYTPEIFEWLTQEGKLLLDEAKERINERDVSYFTLESTLCCYKSWHRVNRRYPNVYNDMFHDRIRYAEGKWGGGMFDLFWDARVKYLPEHLRVEHNPADPGLHPLKQNHYRLTGQVIMMDKEDQAFALDAKPWERRNILLIGSCGVGKTWVMTRLLAEAKNARGYALGKILFVETDDYIVVGKYDGSVFQGSDRLSMSAITDIGPVLRRAEKQGKVCIWEGDRFTNSTFVTEANPIIIRILGDGAQGRAKRGSQQTERHIKSIATRVANMKAQHEVHNSQQALQLILDLCKQLNSSK